MVDLVYGGRGDVDDAELLEAWRAGDRSAGSQLFGRHFSAVYRFFRNKVGSQAEDLTQRTFLALVEGRDRFDGASSFRTYMFAVARNKLLMHLRTAGRARKRFDPETYSIADVGASASRLAVAHEEQQVVLAALQMIPVDYQTALELHYFEDMPIAAIAEVMGSPVGTVKARLSRGRNLLRDRLQEIAGSEALAQSTVGELDRWVKSLPQCFRRHSDDASPGPSGRR